MLSFCFQFILHTAPRLIFLKIDQVSLLLKSSMALCYYQIRPIFLKLVFKANLSYFSLQPFSPSASLYKPSTSIKLDNFLFSKYVLYFLPLCLCCPLHLEYTTDSSSAYQPVSLPLSLKDSASKKAFLISEDLHLALSLHQSQYNQFLLVPSCSRVLCLCTLNILSNSGKSSINTHHRSSVEIQGFNE